LIDQITNPHVTKIREAPCKKRIKGRMSKDKRVMSEINNNIQKVGEEASLKAQQKCLLCGIPGHYKKKCPNAQNGIK